MGWVPSKKHLVTLGFHIPKPSFISILVSKEVWELEFGECSVSFPGLEAVPQKLPTNSVDILNLRTLLWNWDAGTSVKLTSTVGDFFMIAP